MSDSPFGPDAPRPLIQPESRFFWDRAHEGSLWLRRCLPCDRTYFYPRDRCPRCASSDTQWVRSSGVGTLYTYAIVHRAPAEAFRHAVPYVVAVVELEDGTRLPTALVDAPIEPAEIRIGARVEAVFEPVDEAHTLVRFRLVPGG